jgi:hypothetical protein
MVEQVIARANAYQLAGLDSPRTGDVRWQLSLACRATGSRR